MIISRYLKKEVFTSLLAVTFILLLIFLSNRLVRYLSYAASGKIPASLLLQLMGLEIPYYLGILLPLGLFLGIILTYSRMYADNEIRVLHACGMSRGYLLRITGVLACFVAIITTYLMLWLNPFLAEEKGKLLARQSGPTQIINTLIPGSFRVTKEGNQVIYVEKISRNHKYAHNIFIAEQLASKADDTGTRWMVLSAERGYTKREQTTRQPFIVTEDGNRYEGVPGQQDYKLIQFQRYGLAIPNEIMASKRQQQEAIPTKSLWQNRADLESAGEFQWRLSIPLSAFLLALLAIPFSQVRPRQSRYAMLLPAIFLYVIYMNLLFVARNMLEQKMVKPFLGLWWVHGLMALFLLLVLITPKIWRGLKK